ncbi:MAG: winged helix-turn-helix domain-containing protein [Methylococcales bacterium]
MTKQKTTTHSPADLVKAKQPVATEVSQEKPKKPVAEVKPTISKPAPKITKKAAVKPVAQAKEISMQELVGTTAGSIWRYLDTNGATTVAKLIRELPEDEKIIQRSIGWLAQEDKITLTIIDRSETIALKE